MGVTCMLMPDVMNDPVIVIVSV